jgi:hypothetical protein
MDTCDAFRAGYSLGRAQLRASLRRAAPALLASMNPRAVEARIDTFAVVDFLIGCWLDNSDGAVEIDWSLFTEGITPEKAMAAFDGIQTHCASLGSDAGTK